MAQHLTEYFHVQAINVGEAAVDTERFVNLRCAGMPEAYREVASNLGCLYFDANTVTSASKVDGVHLDSDQHLTLGAALATLVHPILATN
jgi:hypothetical protein